MVLDKERVLERSCVGEILGWKVSVVLRGMEGGGEEEAGMDGSQNSLRSEEEGLGL